MAVTLLRPTALILAPALLLALAGCGVESHALPSLPAPPRLGSMGTGPVVCPPPTGECTGANQGRCCANNVDCSYKRCAFEGQICEDETCFSPCAADPDCASVPEADPAIQLVCGSEGLCVPRGCTSNRGCDAGQVCQAAEDAGICVAATAGEADPGCSISISISIPSPASRPVSGTLVPAVAGLLLLGARARRRRRRSE